MTSQKKYEYNWKTWLRMHWVKIVGILLFVLIVSILSMKGYLVSFFFRPLPTEWVEVPAGGFIMGSYVKGYNDERPVHAVYLDAFEIGRYEVTNQQYRQCMRAGVCTEPANQKYSLEEYARHPVTFVSWDQAKAFCAWVDRKGRLPTEAEWEKAARGTDERTYPWGEGLGERGTDCSKANYAGCVGDTTEVGIYENGVSPYGLYDMAGNVWEWTADVYDSEYYSYSPNLNPSGPAEGRNHVLRGGSWGYAALNCRASYRELSGGPVAGMNSGIRCARSLP